MMESSSREIRDPRPPRHHLACDDKSGVVVSVSRGAGEGEVRSLDKPSDCVQSVARATRILEIAGKPGGVTVKELAEQLGMKVASVYHLVHTLMWEGYLRRLPHWRYGLGLEVAERFNDLQVSLRSPMGARQVLRWAAARTKRTHLLAKFVDGQIVESWGQFDRLGLMQQIGAIPTAKA